jgi:hypothetical protein
LGCPRDLARDVRQGAEVFANRRCAVPALYGDDVRATNCLTMRRAGARCLSSGTSPERIAPESVTPPHCRFVHRNISREFPAGALDQVWRGSTSDGFSAESLKLRGWWSRIRSRRESMVIPLAPASEARPLSHGERVGVRGYALSFILTPHPICCANRPLPTGEVKEGAAPAYYCVFAGCGGAAEVWNSVASSTAVPSGVGTCRRNGTRMRVPAIGTSTISMLRWVVRYLITGRSGI